MKVSQIIENFFFNLKSMFGGVSGLVRKLCKTEPIVTKISISFEGVSFDADCKNAKKF
jgi:hypothetical protein